MKSCLYRHFLHNDQLTCVKKISFQCYRLYNFLSFRSSHCKCSARKDILRTFAKFTRKNMWQSLFFNKVAGWSNYFWSFSYLLLKISCLFHFNRKMILKKGNTLMEFKYLLFCLSSPPFFCGSPHWFLIFKFPPTQNFHLIYSWLQLDSNPQPLSS